MEIPALGNITYVYAIGTNELTLCLIKEKHLPCMWAIKFVMVLMAFLVMKKKVLEVIGFEIGLAINIRTWSWSMV